MDFHTLCLSITVLMIIIYYYFTSTFNFWKSHGIPGPRPIPIFGNVMDIMLARKSLNDYMCEIYNKFKDERMIGIFSRMEPVLFLKDLDLIKDVFVKDFSVFPDRAGFSPPEETNLTSQHLVVLKANKWRPLRTKLTPIFTSGKLKEMFPLVLKSSEHLKQHIMILVSKDKPIELHKLMSRYTIDVIGKCLFGIETNTLLSENNEFHKLGWKIFHPSWYNTIRLGIKDTMPKIYNVLNYILPQTQVTKFLLRITRENFKYRELNNIVRHDFIDALRHLKKHSENIDFDVTDSLLVSQVFIFLAAGFETSALTLSHALYELAINSKIQDKLREEINSEIVKNENKLTYDSIKNMSYLDKVFKETLRKYPPGTFLSRRSMRSYTFSGTNLNIPKGQRVWIPVFAIHWDAQYYPEPDVFDPERFNEDMIQTRHSMSYLPFGTGPRNCIGLRFAVYQTKIGLITVLRNYKVETCEKTQIPYISCPKAFLLRPKDGIYLRISKLDWVD